MCSKKKQPVEPEYYDNNNNDNNNNNNNNNNNIFRYGKMLLASFISGKFDWSAFNDHLQGKMTVKRFSWERCTSLFWSAIQMLYI